MLISKKWLETFVEIPKDLSDEDLAKKISLSTVEVEETIDQAQCFENIVTGQITSVEKHPNADKLRLCQVDVGKKNVQVVCGGANVAEGMNVAMALVGSKVRWHGEGDLVELKKTKIRGEESEGMICASAEIGLVQTEGDDEIRDLGDVEAPLGTHLAEALGINDVVYDIEHKSLTNRPDLMGHYGMAREVAALVQKDLKAFELKEIVQGKGVALDVSVKDAAACPRYMAVAMDGVKIESSPEWMQRRLEACGVRPINNVVDVTNFVLLELGQPMHAFDADDLGGDKVKIVVRSAKKGEEIVALDEETYKLYGEDLLITDGKRALAIAGVMGGEGSGVTEKTTRVVFESANFDPVAIRKTSTKLGLRSESSARFEKSLDPRMCNLALCRAAQLMQELCPEAKVCSEVVDVKKDLPKPLELTFTVDQVNACLGAEIGVKEMTQILERLGFEVAEKKEELKVIVPSWRATKDVEIKEDVFEEIARIYGYERIESTLPTFETEPPFVDSVRMLSRTARQALAVGCGGVETYQYAFVRPETLVALGETAKDHIELANPLAADRPYLVRSLVPNLLEVVVRNQRTTDEVRVFQVERVFRKDEKGLEMGEGKSLLPNQPHMVCAVYSCKCTEEPVWEVKAMLDNTLRSLGFKYELKTSKKVADWQHPLRAAEVVVCDTVIGALGEIAPENSENLGLDHRAAFFELNLDVLAGLDSDVCEYKTVSVHPHSDRDLAFVVAERAQYGLIESALVGASSLLESVKLFDVYRGDGVEEEKKSMAVRLRFRSSEKTLASEEVDAELEKIRGVLEKEFDATMRS